MAEISDKELRILRSVIDLYVKEGTPVSSLKIKQFTGIGLSTASIRNVLAKLEGEGMLMKPHTSAGRVPTDEGYRVYVNSIEPDQALCHEFSEIFREEVKEQRNMNTIMESASRILGSLSKNFAVVYGSLPQESKVSRIYLVFIESTRILVILRLLPEYERTVMLRTEKQFDPETVKRAEALINPIIMDKTLEEAKDSLDSVIRDNITDEGIIMREVAANREEIFSEPPAVELYFEDRGHLLEQPELSDPALLQLLLRLLHDKEYLTSVLSKRLEEKTTVTIGTENEDDALRHFSLVTSGYRMGGARGVLGIIGPTRMQYDYAYYLVASIAKELRAIGEEFF